MDAVWGIKFPIKLGPEPDESLVPAFYVRIGRVLAPLGGVIPSPIPRRLPGPLGAGRGSDRGRNGGFRWDDTLDETVSRWYDRWRWSHLL